MSFSSTIVAIPFVFIYPLPASPAWPYVILSACLQVGYSVFLVAAYRHGELGQVYPIVRGTVPLLVTLGGFLLADEHLSTWRDRWRLPRRNRHHEPFAGKGRAGNIIDRLCARDGRHHRELRDCRCDRRPDCPAIQAPTRRGCWCSTVLCCRQRSSLARGKLAVDVRSPETWESTGQAGLSPSWPMPWWWRHSLSGRPALSRHCAKRASCSRS